MLLKADHIDEHNTCLISGSVLIPFVSCCSGVITALADETAALARVANGSAQMIGEDIHLHTVNIIYTGASLIRTPPFPD